MKVFNTIVRPNHPLNKEYVIGVITGMQALMCDESPFEGFVQTVYETGACMLTTKCLKEEYWTFASIIETRYPGLCVFNA